MEIMTRDKEYTVTEAQRRPEPPDLMRAWEVYASAFLELVTPTGNEVL